MKPEQNPYPIKLGVVTNLDEAFENYGVGWNPKGLFNLLSDAVRYDALFSESYEFTRIFNWNSQYADPSHAARPYKSNARSLIRDTNASLPPTRSLEQITSHFSTEEELMNGLDAYDIDFVLAYYCHPFSIDSARDLNSKYDIRLLIFDPSDYLDLQNRYYPQNNNFECTPETAEIGTFYSLLTETSRHPDTMGSVLIGRETRLEERQNRTKSTIDDINNYLGSN